MKACKDIDPEKSIKTFNVMARIVSEIFNDLTNGLTKESLGLIAALIMIIMCCCGKCGISRGDSGKVKISVGNVDDLRQSSVKKTPMGSLEPPKPKYK